MAYICVYADIHTCNTYLLMPYHRYHVKRITQPTFKKSKNFAFGRTQDHLSPGTFIQYFG